ncbi:hypothetical protein BP5796_10679 [Coleophoma crateriformis]|uniref:Hcy-binding domain-containing protein n=1 Tax=Coleophoma crateriformis TaxID=565419 RepID=A0A3D8QQX5_9HELO|nr:hypothetical protein BP5796_10679 [Coleophoma crateriformis]
MASRKTPILLLDGGLGTTLADQHGCVFDASTPLWSSSLLLKSPETLLECQSDFAAAGADIILTDTYQASFKGFASEGSTSLEQSKEYMRSAVQIAGQAFEKAGKGNGKVALSLGAYGATMIPGQEYSGKYDEERLSAEGLRKWHQERIQVFSQDANCWDQIHIVAFETLPMLPEVVAVREVMEGVGKPFWIACVFPGEGTELPDSSAIKDIVKAMLGGPGSNRPIGIGMNCTKIGKLDALISEFEIAIKEMVTAGEVTEWPALVLYPDGTNGEVYNTTTQEWEVKDPNGRSDAPWDERIFDIVSKVEQRDLWSSIVVGGCCKTTPNDIGKLRKRIDQHW